MNQMKVIINEWTFFCCSISMIRAANTNTSTLTPGQTKWMRCKKNRTIIINLMIKLFSPVYLMRQQMVRKYLSSWRCAQKISGPIPARVFVPFTIDSTFSPFCSHSSRSLIVYIIRKQYFIKTVINYGPVWVWRFTALSYTDGHCIDILCTRIDSSALRHSITLSGSSGRIERTFSISAKDNRTQENGM